MSIENGGPAFPNVPEGAGEKWQDWDQGMALRDYFAAKAMQARAAGEYSAWADLAADAYNIADAMLASRNEPR